LEHDANAVPSQMKELFFVVLSQILAFEQNLARCWVIETCEKVQQRRLTRTGSTYERDEFTESNFEVYIPNSVNGFTPKLILAGNVCRLNYRR
jgi:hypothetical protein